MSEQTPSGNRWEPTDPHDREAASAPGAEAPPSVTPPTTPPTTPPPTQPPTQPTTPPTTPPPAAAVPERPGRWRTLGPGGQGWLAAGLSALVVLVGLGGFLAGRASVDDPAPAEVGQQWRHGDDGDGRPFDGGPDGVPGGAPDGAPDGAPGTNS